MDVFSYKLGKAKGGGGTEPTGTITITENGTHNVKNYASASVNVPVITPTGTINITSNGTYDVTNKASAEVNVSGGGADLSEYFDTEIKSNTSSSDYMKYGTVVKKTPPFTVDENVTALDYCFRNWPFPTIDVSKMDTSNITDMDNMFYQTSLTSLDCSNFDTSKVTTFTEMFYGCNSLKYLNLSSFTFKTTGNNPSLQGMFNANKITTLDISNMDFSIVRASFNNMFLNCGTQCKQSDGAYADGIPYVYVKDATAQNWVLTANNSHPNTWTTANVVIKS